MPRDCASKRGNLSWDQAEAMARGASLDADLVDKRLEVGVREALGLYCEALPPCVAGVVMSFLRSGEEPCNRLALSLSEVGGGGGGGDDRGMLRVGSTLKLELEASNLSDHHPLHLPLGPSVAGSRL